MRKLIGIFIVTLLISTTILPIAISEEKNDKNQISNEAYVDDCGCNSNYGISSNIIKKFDKNIHPDLLINGVPDYFNWKDFGGQDWTTTAKDQGYCGSCWVHTALGSLEGVINIREGSAVIDPDLSEQYVLSCLPDAAYPKGEGCSQGDNYWALQLMMATTPEGNYHNGALLEECFPYQADDDVPCDEKCVDWVDKLVPIVDTLEWYPSFSLENLSIIKSQIMEKGPVGVSMYTSTDFRGWFYSSHDPNDYYSYYETTYYNHLVVLIGWNDDSSIGKGGYWICKNSWGTDGGYDGFFNIEYGSLNIACAVCWVDYDPESYEWDNEPNPPSVTTINGKTNGAIKTEYEYTFNSVDPEGKDIRYYISWGDGDWEWTDYYPSGEDVTVKHNWEEKGDYSVVALAMNTDNNIGAWGTLEISMPKNKLYAEYNPLFFRLIKWHPILEFLIQYPVNL